MSVRILTKLCFNYVVSKSKSATQIAPATSTKLEEAELYDDLSRKQKLNCEPVKEIPSKNITF